MWFPRVFGVWRREKLGLGYNSWRLLRKNFETLARNAQGYREYLHLKTGAATNRKPLKKKATPGIDTPQRSQ